jgi:hypothetical protein
MSKLMGSNNPDSDTALVFSVYGLVMFTVQIFEAHLGRLWMWRQVGEHETTTTRNIKKGIARMIHATHRASASELLKGLDGQLEEQLFDELGRLIQWRDVLAHRYLRERYRPSGSGGRFATGTYQELLGLRDDFVASSLALEQLIDANEAELQDELASWSPEEIAAVENFGQRILRQDPNQ